MNIEELAEKFKGITEKYKLKDEQKAEEISHYLMNNQEVSAKEFSELFAMDIEDAKIFLTFIQAGIEYKQDHLKSE